MNIYYLYLTFHQTSSANANSRFIPRSFICNKLNYVAHKFVFVYDPMVSDCSVFLTDTNRSNHGNLPLQRSMLRFGVRETPAFIFSNIYLHNAYQGIYIEFAYLSIYLFIRSTCFIYLVT